MFYEVSIQAAPAGFGEYQCQPINGDGWDEAVDLLSEISSAIDGDVCELGATNLPASLEDIRGLIHNEPEQVFAILHADGNTTYFGITER